MSYYFTMAFATVQDRNSAFELCQKTVNLLSEKPQVQEHAKNMYQSFKMRCFYEGVKLEDGELGNFLRDMWVQDVFQVRFVYWPQHKLLALCGDNYPKAVKSLFGPQIQFQNAVDQDYEVDTWDPNVSIFGAIIDGISKAGDETIRSLLGYDEDETFGDEDYARRSAVYKAIFKVLDLDNWLYGRDGQFERIKMSGLTSQEKIQDVQRWVRSAVQKI